MSVSKMSFVLVSCVLGLAAACRPFAPSTDTAAVRLYIAPNGNDAADGSSRAPLASLEGAKQKIRALKKNGPLPAGGVTVFVRGGTYFLRETFRLGKEDSGTADAPVTYRASQGEKVFLFGGRPITGFVPYQGSILKADVAAQGLKGVDFRQLFFDNQRQCLARYPNFDPQNPLTGGWAYVDGAPVQMYKEIPGEDKRTLVYKPQDARTWSRPTDGEVLIFPRYNWWNNIVAVAARDTSKRTLTLARDASYAIRPNDRYFVQNLFEELDAPGEWYLDRATDTLYFWPPSPLENKTVCAPTLRTLIAMDPGAAHVTIRGFDLQCCDGTAVELKGSIDCLIAGNAIHNTGDYNGSGVAVSDGLRNGVVGNDIYEVGSHGVSIGGGDRKTLTPAGNYADNNYIHHIGVFSKHGLGISLNGVGNRASHNLIHDVPRAAIGFMGNNLVIEYNHIRHAMLETEDAGTLSTGGRDWISSRGSSLRYNFIHDVQGYSRDRDINSLTYGIYPDDNTGGLDIYGNIIARVPCGLIFLHNARDTRIENNILIDGGSVQVVYTGWMGSGNRWARHHDEMVNGYESVAGQPAWRAMRNMDLHPTNAVLPNGMTMLNNVFRRNICSYRDPKAGLYALRNVPLDHNAFDYNLIYHFNQPVKIKLAPFPPTPSTLPEDKAKAASKANSEAEAPADNLPGWWRAAGADAHSLLADPLFVDPAKDDYRLKPESPAFKLGFQPIPVDKIGPYADPLRASWPIVEAPGARERAQAAVLK